MNQQTTSKPQKSSNPKAALRREGREAVILFLFEQDSQGVDSAEAQTPDNDFWYLRNGINDPDDTSADQSPAPAPLPQKFRTFAEQRIQGVLANRTAIDDTIARFTQNYELHRLSLVDRNILRLAIFEMIHLTDVPAPVAINEAIEIAKKFGTEESGRFVNGVLDRVRKEANLPSRPPSKSSQKPSE